VLRTAKRLETLICASAALLAGIYSAGCSHGAAPFSSVAGATATSVAPQAPTPSEPAPPPEQTGGFDGAKAYDYTAKLVSFGPRPPASDAIHRTQDYLRTQLQGFGCQVDEDDFHAQTPIGEVAMKNIVAKAPGTGQGIILLLTHYDTLRNQSPRLKTTAASSDFVGADDAGSSTGLMLELAQLLCAKKGEPNSVWMAFVDGEEAFVDWDSNNDNTYGSRQLAAKMATSGELKRVKAVMLADMIGPYKLRIKKDQNSTPWLTEMVWKNALKLGYKDYFVSVSTGVSDDHLSFLHRDVPSVDVIDLDDYPYWHTTEDTMDKISPRSLAIVGHVFLETVNDLQKKFR
jgi:glutaminyl-peptide cyclotransferase